MNSNVKHSLPQRKVVRLSCFDYNSLSAVFLTICTKNRACILSRIVGTGVPDGPRVELTQYGKIADKYINQLDKFYSNMSIDKYVIMPNHIHILLSKSTDGPSGTPVPTTQNTFISKFVSTFKRFCNKEFGDNVWQSRSYDHVIRNKADYDEHIKYIADNPIKWHYDNLYSDN